MRTTTWTRSATSWCASAARQATNLLAFILALLPWLLGLVAGLVVSLTLWLVVAALDGYRAGRVRWEP